MARWNAEWSAPKFLLLVLLVAVTAAFAPRPSRAQSGYPTIRIWALAGAFQDSTIIPGQAYRCPGAMQPRPDSLRVQPRTISVRFLRDRVAEARPDFGGYRIYRMIDTPDTNQAMLIRRYSVNAGSELSWRFSLVDTTTLQFMCNGVAVHDSVVSFVDPDSSGDWQKVCRRRDSSGRCLSSGDSVYTLVAPPGPHDGFRTYYSITYELLNGTEANYADAFVPDTLDSWARCGVRGQPATCPNLNNKLHNLVGPIEPTGGPTRNLETVGVVPNPYRGSEAWDQTGRNEIHFINLPAHATIKIFTVAGDLVRELHHGDSIKDFEIWDLTSGTGKPVSSGIYIYRVVSGAFTFQNRFIVIR